MSYYCPVWVWKILSQKYYLNVHNIISKQGNLTWEQWAYLRKTQDASHRNILRLKIDTSDI